jgi:hypothetical protein
MSHTALGAVDIAVAVLRRLEAQVAVRTKRDAADARLAP